MRLHTADEVMPQPESGIFRRKLFSGIPQSGEKAVVCLFRGLRENKRIIEEMRRIFRYDGSLDAARFQKAFPRQLIDALLERRHTDAVFLQQL